MRRRGVITLLSGLALIAAACGGTGPEQGGPEQGGPEQGGPEQTPDGQEAITAVDEPTRATDPVVVLLAAAGPLAAVTDVAEVTWQVEGCDGGQLRLGVAVLAGSAGDGDIAALPAAYAQRWAAAGWHVDEGTDAVGATTPEGLTLDLRTGDDRAGLAVRGPCADAAALAPSTAVVDALAAAELLAVELISSVAGEGAAVTSTTDQPLCGDGWRQTVVTIQAGVDDAAAAVDTLRAHAPEGAVDLAASTVAVPSDGGGLVVVTAAGDTLQARAHAPCHPTGT